jgi:hypothetical protein
MQRAARKRRPLIIGGAILVIITLVVIITPGKRRPKGLEYVREQEIIPSLKDGDIICRLGDRPWSFFFKEISPKDKRFSHLGIVRINNGVISVINAEGSALEGRDQVNEVSLTDFLKVARSIGIYRLRDFDGGLISKTALEFKGRPFDWQFDMNEDDKLYCSELLFVIIKKLRPEIELNTIWLKELGKYIIPVDVCSQSDYFIEVGYFAKRNI